MEEKKEEVKNEETGEVEEISLEECLKENETLKKELEELKAKLQKTEDAAKKLSVLYQSLQKEFEDYKARMRKEKEEAKEEGALRLAKGFMEIVDNFEKALESAQKTTDINALMKGIQMIHYQLSRFLQEQGIEKIETSTGFNPMEHEAVETVVSKEHAPNEIIKVIQTGYKYRGRTIRPAKVIVAIPPEEREEIT
ncbi:molecular chaperone GrpE [Persephonella hydrogeniphila]|uniref:Protein GrpE n=1 Tax=Persephonella hydrogeniphila TaxID=198703 RepID=A0A285N1B0_9AQUI|nr:nucleotide exchange factor GrpE [Persephonella hydrogeniphila]SNZ02713.1 molecular chaperone GrpE [Persephonella hydrogeniphila]